MADTATAEMIRNILTDREPRELSGEGKRAAGVLVLCSSNTEGQHTLILTKRTSSIREKFHSQVGPEMLRILISLPLRYGKPTKKLGSRQLKSKFWAH